MENRSAIGIDVGGTNLRFALVDREGRILQRERKKTEIHLGREPFLARLAEGIAALKGHAAGQGMDVCAVGAGIPGLVSNEGLIHSSVNLVPIEGLNLREILSGVAGLPAAVANDANAAAYGEKAYGAGRPFSSFLMATLGTGVGGGMVLNDRLWTGVDGVAGEFGHVTVEPEGRRCPCGNRGCLEQYASATALATAAREAAADSGASALARLTSEEMTAEALAAAARAGDGAAVGIFAAAGRYLGIAAASVANLLNLEAFIVGGGVADSFDLLVEPICREIRERSFPIPGGRLRVVKSELGDDAGLLGSAALAMEMVFKET